MIFERITSKNIEDVVSICSWPDLEGNRVYEEAIKTREKWLRNLVSKFGSAGMVAYEDEKTAGFIECMPISNHPFRKFTNKNSSAIINCAQEIGVYDPDTRKAIFGKMKEENFFNELLKKSGKNSCDSVYVLAVRGIEGHRPYSLYQEIGFKDSVQFDLKGDKRYVLMEYPLKNQRVEEKTKKINPPASPGNRFKVGVCQQCWAPHVEAHKLEKASDKEYGVARIDYWNDENVSDYDKVVLGSGEILLGNQSIFDEPLFYLSKSQIKEKLKSKNG